MQPRPRQLQPIDPVVCDGATLYLRRGGTPDGPVVVAVHGFTQDGSCWAPYVARRGEFDWWVPDLRGHGRTGAVAMSAGADPLQAYGFDASVADLCAVAARAAGPSGRPVHLVGYSLGGRLGLCAVVADPRRWAHVSVLGANPGLTDPAERAARTAADDALAADLERDGLDAFIERWERLPLFAGLADAPDDVQATLRAARHGHDPHALAAMLRGTSVGRQRDLRPELAALAAAGALPPIVAAAGADDAPYVTRANELALVTHADVVQIAGAGHAAHLEAPEQTAACVPLWTGDPH